MLHLCPPQLQKKNQWKHQLLEKKAIIKIRSPSATFLFAGTCTLRIQSKMLGAFFPQIACIKMFSSSRTFTWFDFSFSMISYSLGGFFFSLLDPHIVQNSFRARVFESSLIRNVSSQRCSSLWLWPFGASTYAIEGQQFRHKWLENTCQGQNSKHVRTSTVGGGMEKYQRLTTEL